MNENAQIKTHAWSPGQTIPHEFFEVAQIVYQNDPFWLGESSAETQKKFSTVNPWFQDGQAWLGIAPNCGRLAGFFKPDLRIHDVPVAFFGYWETLNELDINEMLFKALKKWAQSLGAKHLYGPINFSTFNAYRIRTNAFEDGAFFGEPWNPDYYPNLMNQLGFEVEQTYFSTTIPHPVLMKKVGAEYAAIESNYDESIQVHPLTPEYWLANLETFYEIAHIVFKDNFAYSHISFETFKEQYGQSFAQVFCPRTSLYITSNDELAAFLIAIPDYAPLIRERKRNQQPCYCVYANDFDDMPQPKTILGKTMGVHPKYRSKGLTTMMIWENVKRAQNLYDAAIAALARSDNRSGKLPSRLGGVHHEYALYGCKL